MKQLFNIAGMAILLIFTVIPDMAYSTDTDIYDRVSEELVIQLTDDDNTGQVNQDVLERNRATCHEIVNSYLRGRYQVPVDPPTPVLASIEADLLADKLYSRRANIEKPETIKNNFSMALKSLQAIARGDMKLEDQPDLHQRSFVTNKKRSDKDFPDDRLNKF